jgi:hypothetical protein
LPRAAEEPVLLAEQSAIPEKMAHDAAMREQARACR